MFTAVYRHKKSGTEVVVHTLSRPTSKTRTFRARGGRRKFDLIKLTSRTKEFIVMGKSQKKAKDEVTDDELKELENLEGTDDEEPEAEADDETVEETPKKKGKKGKKDKAGKKGKGKGKAKTSRAAANGKVGTQEIVAYVNENGLSDKPIDSRQLRMVLRKHRGEKGIELDPETNRWEWDSIDAKPVQAIIKFVKAGEVEAAKQEGLDRLKQNREDAKAKQEDGKGKKKGKKKNKNK